MSKIYEKGFTLIEIMVVIVIMSVIAGFSIPNFRKAVRKSHEQDALLQLQVIFAASHFYYSKNGNFLDSGGSIEDLDFINTNLGINVVANGLTYTYQSDGTTYYYAWANWDEAGVANDFTLRISKIELNRNFAWGPPYNPCCSAGSCPSGGNC
jgi:prepilin-type N-terminal cleavage/methylation domain-containing protein